MSASKRRSHCTYEPRPTGAPRADDAAIADAFVGRFRDRHYFRPRTPIAVVDDQTDRTAHRPAEAHAGQNANLVGFDVLPISATVAELAPLRLLVQIRGVELDARRNAFDDPE